MKILIVEDEKLAIIRLKRLIEEIGNYEILTTESSEEALYLLDKNPDIDIVFLDIKMPNMSGIELAYKILTKRDNIFIVFQTAYEEHALEAFQIGAIDYLLKPYTLEDIKKVFNRVEKLRSIKQKTKFMVKLVSGDYKIISSDDIFYIKAELKDSLIRTKEDYIYYPLSISKFQEKLKNDNFIRVHKSYLINIDKISIIRTTIQSKLIFKFEGINDMVISSKEGAKYFREIFKNKYHD